MPICELKSVPVHFPPETKVCSYHLSLISIYMYFTLKKKTYRRNGSLSLFSIKTLTRDGIHVDEWYATL